MFDQIPQSTMSISILFAFVSVVMCISQILLKKRYQFLKLCKLFAFLPFAASIIKIFSGMAQALNAIVKANDLSNAVIYDGIATMLFSLILGIYITFFLAVLYGITVAVYENQECKTSVLRGGNP